MKLKPIGKNVSELTLNNGTVVLFSYQTPVAACYAGGFIRTDKDHSKTTSKHITQWLEGRKATTVAQNMLDALVK